MALRLDHQRNHTFRTRIRRSPLVGIHQRLLDPIVRCTIHPTPTTLSNMVMAYRAYHHPSASKTRTRKNRILDSYTKHSLAIPTSTHGPKTSDYETHFPRRPSIHNRRPIFGSITPAGCSESKCRSIKGQLDKGIIEQKPRTGTTGSCWRSNQSHHTRSFESRKCRRSRSAIEAIIPERQFRA